MKWFQVDSDTPNDPKVKAVIRRGITDPDPGQAAAGVLLLLWCYVADHGGGVPGEGVDGDGMPLPLQEMADECLFASLDQLTAFLTFLAEKGHIDPDRWAAGVVFLPAMFKRADSYARSKGRGDKPARPGGNSPPQDKTPQDTTDTTGQGGLFEGAPPLPGLAPPTAEALVAVWNRCRTKGPTVRGLDDKRRRVINAALKAEPDLDKWAKLITWCDGQAWMNAPGTGNHPKWRLDIDYLTRPGQMLRTVERMEADKGGTSTGGRAAPTPGKFTTAVEDE